MSDRLVSLLKWFDLRARVFQAGPLCRSVSFDGGDGLGYITCCVPAGCALHPMVMPHCCSTNRAWCFTWRPPGTG